MPIVLESEFISDWKRKFQFSVLFRTFIDLVTKFSPSFWLKLWGLHTEYNDKHQTFLSIEMVSARQKKGRRHPSTVRFIIRNNLPVPSGSTWWDTTDHHADWTMTCLPVGDDEFFPHGMPVVLPCSQSSSVSRPTSRNSGIGWWWGSSWWWRAAIWEAARIVNFPGWLPPGTERSANIREGQRENEMWKINLKSVWRGRRDGCGWVEPNQITSFAGQLFCFFEEKTHREGEIWTHTSFFAKRSYWGVRWWMDGLEKHLVKW